MSFGLTTDDVLRLYGKQFFYLAGESTSVQAKEPATSESSALPEEEPVFTWKLKPDTHVVFLLRPEEYSDKKLTELLRKIVTATQVPSAQVGFGIMSRRPEIRDYENIPARYAIVLDETAKPDDASFTGTAKTRIWFSYRLKGLETNDTRKRELWNALKEMMNIYKNG